MKEIKNGGIYPKTFKENVVKEYKHRAKSKVGVTYRAIARDFNIHPNTVKEWVTEFRPHVTAMKRPNGCLYYKDTLYAPVG